MITRREAMEALAAGSTLLASTLIGADALAQLSRSAKDPESGASGPKPGVAKVTKLIEQPLPGMDDKVAVAVLVELAPGVDEAAHHHPGPAFVYILDGAVSVSVGNKPPSVYKEGQMYYEPAMHTHRESTEGQSGPVRFLAFLILEKGQPLLIPGPAGT